MMAKSSRAREEKKAAEIRRIAIFSQENDDCH